MNKSVCSLFIKTSYHVSGRNTKCDHRRYPPCLCTRGTGPLGESVGTDIGQGGPLNISPNHFETLLICLLQLLAFTRITNTTAAATAMATTTLPKVPVKKPEGVDLYARFAVAGAFGCSLTHGAFTPVDV